MKVAMVKLNSQLLIHLQEPNHHHHMVEVAVVAVMLLSFQSSSKDKILLDLEISTNHRKIQYDIQPLRRSKNTTRNF
jgi:hypothetical protein